MVSWYSWQKSTTLNNVDTHTTMKPLNKMIECWSMGTINISTFIFGYNLHAYCGSNVGCKGSEMVHIPTACTFKLSGACWATGQLDILDSQSLGHITRLMLSLTSQVFQNMSSKSLIYRPWKTIISMCHTLWEQRFQTWLFNCPTSIGKHN